MDLGNITVAEAPNADIGILGPIVDPAIWETTVALPNVSDKPARLAVREYERYYTDRFVPEMVGRTIRQRGWSRNGWCTRRSSTCDGLW